MPRAATAPDLPLYPSEDEIARAVLGRNARHWRDMREYLEKLGLPKINSHMGGRYWPAVVDFFNKREGLDEHGTIGGRIRLVPPPPDYRDAPQTEAMPSWGGDRRARRARP